MRKVCVTITPSEGFSAQRQEVPSLVSKIGKAFP